MADDTFSIRVMKATEVPVALDWAAAEGWNPGLNDADCYLTADAEGFLMGVWDEIPIAIISAMRYGAGFGFLGFYIVAPEYRGQGFGMRIWNAGMERLEGRNIGLDGVVAQQDNYRKSGFTLAFRNVRYEGTAGGKVPLRAGITDLGAAHAQAVEDYSRPFFPEARNDFLTAWRTQPGGRALGLMQGGNLVGYGVIRPCRQGYKIGPLFADNRDIAEALFTALQGTAAKGARVYLDVPETNDQAAALAEDHNMTRVFETARMYTGAEPDIQIPRTFGITSFEIG